MPIQEPDHKLFQKLTALNVIQRRIEKLPTNLQTVFASRFMRLHFRMTFFKEPYLKRELEAEAENDAKWGRRTHSKNLWSDLVDLSSPTLMDDAREAIDTYDELDLALLAMPVEYLERMSRRKVANKNKEGSTRIQTDYTENDWVDLGDAKVLLDIVGLDSSLPDWAQIEPTDDLEMEAEKYEYRKKVALLRIKKALRDEQSEVQLKHPSQ